MERVYLVQSIYNTDKKGDSIIDNYIFDSEKKAKIYFNLNIELTKISFEYADRKYKLYTEENYAKIYNINDLRRNFMRILLLPKNYLKKLVKQ